MKTYQPRYDRHVDFFNKINYGDAVFTGLKEVEEFLNKEGYNITIADSKIIVPTGSPSACMSFIDHRAPLFKGVTFKYDDSVLNEAFVIIEEN